MQPKSRVQQKGSKMSHVVDENEDWVELKKGSINGFFNVVVGLAMWWTAVKTGAQRRVFLEMVNDVSWALDQMMAKLEVGRKHGLEEDKAEDRGRAKRYFVFYFL